MPKKYLFFSYFKAFFFIFHNLLKTGKLSSQLVLFIFDPGLDLVDILGLSSIVCLEGLCVSYKVLLDGCKLIIRKRSKGHVLRKSRNTVFIHQGLNIEHNIGIKLLRDIFSRLTQEFPPAKDSPTAILQSYIWKLVPFDRLIIAQRGTCKKSFY